MSQENQFFFKFTVDTSDDFPEHEREALATHLKKYMEGMLPTFGVTGLVVDEWWASADNPDPR